ncbi:20431_t:CDS:2, partial [Racocetra persica]
MYRIIFRKKTAYSGPAILGFNDKKVVKKLLARHYEDQSANDVWAQARIAIYLD